MLKKIKKVSKKFEQLAYEMKLLVEEKCKFQGYTVQEVGQVIYQNEEYSQEITFKPAGREITAIHYGYGKSLSQMATETYNAANNICKNGFYAVKAVGNVCYIAEKGEYAQWFVVTKVKDGEGLFGADKIFSGFADSPSQMVKGTSDVANNVCGNGFYTVKAVGEIYYIPECGQYAQWFVVTRVKVGEKLFGAERIFNGLADSPTDMATSTKKYEDYLCKSGHSIVKAEGNVYYIPECKKYSQWFVLTSRSWWNGVD